jgi:hypothetical protein
MFLAPYLAAQAEVREPPPGPTPPAAAAPSPPPRGPGGIVAIANDDVITQAELDTRVDRISANLARIWTAGAVDRERARLAQLQLDDLIESRLILQLVRKEEEKEGRPYVTETDIDAQVISEVDRLQKGGAPIKDAADYYNLAREKDGMSREELRKMIKEGLAVERYLARKVYSPRVFVSPQEVRAYYRSHPEEFATPVAVSFQQIVIEMRRDRSTEDLVHAVEEELKEGKPFLEVAKQFSQEARAGKPEDAGLVRKRTFEELEKYYSQASYSTLRSLKKGQTSPRVVTPSNIFYYHVVDLEEGPPKPFSEVQEIITRKMREARHREELGKFIADLKKRSRIQKYLPPLPEPPAKVASSGDKGARAGAAAKPAETRSGNIAPGPAPAPPREPAKPASGEGN